ncbi:MAG: phosphoribosyltransferase [Thaumarchaeota archaeon]|nr:phosphoribosyltransferase [Nitrososphaerota archaeon]
MTKTRSQWKGSSFRTWSDIEVDVKILAEEIKRTGFRFDKIATISRGGLIPARLLADHLDIKNVFVDKNKIPAKTLFIDDIYDSGKTFRKIMSRVKFPDNFVYATLMARRKTRYPKQLIYAKKTKGAEYIVFPWELLEQKRSKTQK